MEQARFWAKKLGGKKINRSDETIFCPSFFAKSLSARINNGLLSLVKYLDRPAGSIEEVDSLDSPISVVSPFSEVPSWYLNHFVRTPGRTERFGYGRFQNRSDFDGLGEPDAFGGNRFRQIALGWRLRWRIRYQSLCGLRKMDGWGILCAALNLLILHAVWFPFVSATTRCSNPH